MKSGALNATMMDTARLFFTQGDTTINLIPALAAGLGLGKHFPHDYYSTHYIIYSILAVLPILFLTWVPLPKISVEIPRVSLGGYGGNNYHDYQRHSYHSYQQVSTGNTIPVLTSNQYNHTNSRYHHSQYYHTSTQCYNTSSQYDQTGSQYQHNSSQY